MHRLVFKFVCYLTLTIQALCASGIAQGATVCTHLDGQTRIESAVQLAACHAKQSETPAYDERTCVDSLLVQHQSGEQPINSRVILLEIGHLPVALPSFFSDLISSLFAKPCVAQLTKLARTVPNGERDSLQTVVLVI